MLPITRRLITHPATRPFLKNAEKYRVREVRAVVAHWTANTKKGADALANRNYFFTIAPRSLEDEVYEKFKAVAFDLMAKGLGMSGPHVTTCEDWWRSRFHDMLYPGAAAPKDHADWLYRHTAETNWKLIWHRFQTDILDGKRTSIR